MIKLFSPTFNNLEIENMIKTVKSGFWASGSGIKNVSKFENKFKKYTNSKSWVALMNCLQSFQESIWSMCIVNPYILHF